jgi:hypothetical protein
MASDSPILAPGVDAAASTRALALALDAIEAVLAGLEPGAAADVVAKKLAGPVRAFDTAALAAQGANSGGNS